MLVKRLGTPVANPFGRPTWRRRDLLTGPQTAPQQGGFAFGKVKRGLAGPSSLRDLDVLSSAFVVQFPAFHAPQRSAFLQPIGRMPGGPRKGSQHSAFLPPLQPSALALHQRRSPQAGDPPPCFPLSRKGRQRKEPCWASSSFA